MNEHERTARLEQELEAAARVLQSALPIGECKHIGMMEVADGVRELVHKIDVLTAENNRLCKLRRFSRLMREFERRELRRQSVMYCNDLRECLAEVVLLAGELRALCNYCDVPFGLRVQILDLLVELAALARYIAETELRNELIKREETL